MFDAFFFDAAGQPILAEDGRIALRISFPADSEPAAIELAVAQFRDGGWQVPSAVSFQLAASGHGFKRFYFSDGTKA